jgi:glutamate N-acetyltransferase / amino-acid N-acetyltransferase
VTVTSPKGFVASGVACGIKSSGALDLALVCTEDHKPVPAAAVFTSNKAKAAPVLVSRRHLEATNGRAAGVVISSGNANAQTGKDGLNAAELMCELAAEGIGSAREEILICQTGLIGVRFPIECAESGIGEAVRDLMSGREAGDRAAKAIMTTDTRKKEVLVEGPGFRIGGIAKGAAMLAPNMATMLAVLTTDARCEPDVLSRILRSAVAASFNEMTVDGCCSTNDTVVLLASGRAGPTDEDELEVAVTAAAAILAEAMVADAEGGTKVARIRVTGAAGDAEARAAARQVAGSMLVKCSINGADPYWGRIVSELGSCGADFDPDRVSVSYGGVKVCSAGVAAPHDAEAVAAHMGGDRIEIECDLELGSGTWSVLTCDLSKGYIDENRTTS